MFDLDQAMQYVHDEIASWGTSSMFIEHGLDPEIGEYDAEEIANAIEAGEFPELSGMFDEEVAL